MVFVYKLLVKVISNTALLKLLRFVEFKNSEKKIKSPLIIYADFEIISMAENHEKQNPEESYTNK